MLNKWKCPRCGKKFEKTPEIGVLQSIGGRCGNLGKPLKCPSCGESLDFKKLLDREYDTW